MYDKNWIVYGAYGYTGTLISYRARERGQRPILAGRRAGRLTSLAAKLGFEHRAFDLDNPAEIRRQISDAALVLHCAGPFSQTAAPMIEACIATGTHYLDITGEIDVFELAQSLDAAARESGVVVCPGVGFDVIPTDCVAAALKHALPDATHLAVGFDSRSGLSPGTAKTTFEGLAKGGKVRRDGKLVTVPLAFRTREIDFGEGPKLAMTIPWGDVATAYHTTGIPNVEAYIAVPSKMVARLKRLERIRPLLRFPPLQAWVKRRISKRVRGPSSEARAANPTYVWGEARNAEGQIRTARLRTANGYDVTVNGALAVVDKLMREEVEPGAYTPARLMGRPFAASLPGSTPIEIT